MSNPPANPRPRRPAPLSVRLNEQELELLRRKAGGMPLSSYLKQAGLGENAQPIRRRLPPSADQKLLATILAALGQSRLSNNLNQLAKAVHSGSLPVNEETETDIRQACRDVRTIREALLRALGTQIEEASPSIAEIFNRVRERAS